MSSPSPAVRSRLRLTWPEVVAFCLLAGVVSTLVRGYGFAEHDQVEQLPLVLRSLDPGFAPGDFYVNASEQFSVRRYFVIMVAGLARVFPLPVLYLLLTILGNSAVGLITLIAARRIAAGDDRPAMFACVLVLSVRSIAPGGAADLTFHGLAPSVPAMPFVLLALWTGVMGRPWLCVLCAVVACLFQPLIAAAAGGIGLLAAGVTALSERRGKAAVGVGAAAILFGVALKTIWLGDYETFLSAREFIDIIGNIRHPHHYIPSTFPLRNWLTTAGLLMALGVSLRWYACAPQADRRITRGILIATVVVVLTWVGGYVFVEVIPTRFWTMLQAFRYAFVIKWFALMLIAVTATRLWATGGSARLPAVLMCAGTGVPQGIIAGWAHVVELLRRRLPGIARSVLLVVAVVFALAAHYKFGWELPEILALALLGLLAFAFGRLQSSAARIASGAALATVITAALILGPFPHMRPHITMAQSLGDLMPAADFARISTPADAIFVVPPRAEAFRTAAERAHVVDFKCIPHFDAGLVGWHQRMRACYGDVPSSGFQMAVDMDQAYHDISDSALAELAETYGADHALLYAETRTALPVLYSDARWKIVRIP